MLGMKIIHDDGSYELTYGLCFDNVDDTKAFFNYISHGYPAWPLRYISQADYAKMPEGSTSPAKSNHFDGQVIVVAKFQGPTDGFKNEEANKTARDFAASFGTVKGFQGLSKAWPNVEYRVEYHKISDAKKVLAAAGKDAAQVVGVSYISVRSSPQSDKLTFP